MTGADRRDPGALQRIREFAAEYYVHHGSRAATPAEQAMIEHALIDYLLGEEYITPPARECVAAAQRGLDEISRSALPPGAQETLQLIERCVGDLAERLERREDANSILQEHLVLLSENLRILRLQSGSDEPQPPYRGDGQ